MVAAIRRTVTVGKAGLIQIQSPELRPGARAEVIVLVENAQAPSALASLDALQKSLALDTQAAQQWILKTNEERKSFGAIRG